MVNGGTEEAKKEERFMLSTMGIARADELSIFSYVS